MGNFQSTLKKDETHRSNRLSKPLSRRVAALSSPVQPHPDSDQPELASGLIGWQNPWVGSTVTKDIRTTLPKPREIPPTLFEAEPTAPEQDMETPTLSPSHVNIEPLSPASDTVSFGPSVRRASYQSAIFSSSSQSSFAPERPRRANSVQTPLQRNRSLIYENTIKTATSSNTHFLVDNQRFSLTRRRSLLTRPGVATRRTTGAIRRVPSPIGEPESHADDPGESTVLQWPLPPCQRASLPTAPPARPRSPADARYTQLGALKLGSLRVVNGGVSPCPSERIPLGRTVTAGPGLGLENVETVCPRGSTLEIPSIIDMKKSEDAPGSPFSFEKSPTLAVPSQSKSVLTSPNLEDEGIGMCDDSNLQLGKTTSEVGIDRSSSRSLNKSDSGYSSAASVRSVHRSQTRASFDSQSSLSFATDSGVPVQRDQLGSRPFEKVQGHLTLQEAMPGNFSRPNPSAVRWYDSSGPATPQSDIRSRRSTLCAPRYTEYPMHDNAVAGRPGSAMLDATHSFPTPKGHIVANRGSLYANSPSSSTVNVAHSSGSPNTLDIAPTPQLISETGTRVHRPVSEHRLTRRYEGSVSHSRSRSRHGSRAWSQKPGTEVPPLPTILSPDSLPAGEEMSFSLPEPSRGRPRSRSQDYRRRRLTKALPPPDVHMMTSAYALH
ncbi:uncharacterized protein N7459_005117 [Penicillium hispanicum]|uniref:uncharacterized protein n=1 Tax=Penicillium hispanicum TaxID=1080232 RepID=UPI0025416C70|nr:uncharacterized protein N7459_005117 [Penicillium hispanicum]KAJ5585317.1 hypothetical protein N7459_005117 [Penicillium hispanicum]